MKTKTLGKFPFLEIVSLAFLVGCGGIASQPINNQPPVPLQPPGVTVSPTSPTVITGGTQQFTATVSPSGANQAVTWSLSGMGCTGAGCGTIDATGKYTAPATVPNPPTVTVTARSVADATKSATATGTIIGAPPTFSLNPTSLAFGNQAINATSAPRTVALTNTGIAPAPVDVVGMNGVNFTDFAQTNNCPSIIAAGASCTFRVTFTPTALGDRFGILNINDGSLLVNFTGTGTAGSTNPVPTINSLFPSCAPVGAQAFTLFVGGLNFVASSVVRWNGNDRPTKLVNNPPQLTAQIPASDTAATGTAAVTVFNPAPGGGSSNTSTFTMGTGGAYPQSIAVDRSGKFAYVANTGCLEAFVGNVSMYTINSTTGALTSIGSPVAADFGAHSVTVDPFGKFVYVANDGDFEVTGGSVSMYTINATSGALTSIGTIASPCAPPPSPGSCAPFSVAVDPSGKFAYVANEGGFAPTSVSMYTINATTGALTFMGTITAAGRAIAVAVYPSGKFAYVVDGSNGFPAENDNVSMYTINATTGVLTSIGTIGTGLSPTSITIDPSGKFAYVPNSGSNDISMYTINATTGALTSIGPIAVAVPPGFIAIDPSGKFAYVSNSIYSINATTGTLSPIGTIPANFSTPIAFHPSGKFAYAPGPGSNVSMYSIDAATGALTLIGTIGT